MENELVVVDVSEAAFIDSSFLHNVVGADRLARERGSRLRLQHGTALIVMRALEVSGILAVLDSVSTREAALAPTPRRPHEHCVREPRGVSHRGVGIPRLIETFQTTLAPDLSLLASLRHALELWLEEVGVADPPRSELVLATHEAAANAIEHAASIVADRDPGRRAAATVVVEIRDHGRWQERRDENEERGRGLKLIESLVSAVKIETDEDGTTLRLLQKI